MLFTFNVQFGLAAQRGPTSPSGCSWQQHQASCSGSASPGVEGTAGKGCARREAGSHPWNCGGTSACVIKACPPTRNGAWQVEDTPPPLQQLLCVPPQDSSAHPYSQAQRRAGAQQQAGTQITHSKEGTARPASCQGCPGKSLSPRGPGMKPIVMSKCQRAHGTPQGVLGMNVSASRKMFWGGTKSRGFGEEHVEENRGIKRVHHVKIACWLVMPCPRRDQRSPSCLLIEPLPNERSAWSQSTVHGGSMGQ